MKPFRQNVLHIMGQKNYSEELTFLGPYINICTGIARKDGISSSVSLRWKLICRFIASSMKIWFYQLFDNIDKATVLAVLMTLNTKLVRKLPSLSSENRELSTPIVGMLCFEY